jgi:lysine N6-hydroxylase
MVSHFRCVGIGVGPANLSLASMLHGHVDITNLFVDRRERFGWHDGQQMLGTSLQVSMLKDLVSLADPTNSFSFLSYLREKGRIYHFINAQFDAVPRQEFRNYLEWAAARNENVVFGETALSVDFDGRFTVRTDKRTVTADNIAVGIGQQPWLPPIARPHLGLSQFHVSTYVENSTGLGGKRVCVVGGGQSGAEAFLDLISRPLAERPRRVSWVSRRRNFLPIDDSPFTNDLYMPDYSGYFMRLSPEIRRATNREQLLTSDGISGDTLRAVYQRIYMQRFVEGAVDRVALFPNREVVAVTPGPGCWELTVRNSNHPDVLGQVDADVVIWATGQRAVTPEFLAPIDHRLQRCEDEYAIDEDFAIRWDGPREHSVFLLNGALEQRGLADKNLSLIAWRSQRIIDRLGGTRADEPQRSFIEWAAKQSWAPSQEA